MMGLLLWGVSRFVTLMPLVPAQITGASIEAMQSTDTRKVLVPQPATHQLRLEHLLSSYALRRATNPTPNPARTYQQKQHRRTYSRQQFMWHHHQRPPHVDTSEILRQCLALLPIYLSVRFCDTLHAEARTVALKRLQQPLSEWLSLEVGNE